MSNRIDWEKIKEDYYLCKDNISLKDFSKKHKVKYSTLRSRKNREKWDDVATSDATKESDVATKNNKKKQKKKIEYQKEIEQLENANLTDKQRLFCIHYVKCFNATKAYQKAYNCRYNSAMVEGFKHLRNPKIVEEIEELKKNKFNRAMLSEDDLFQKYIDIAFSDITDYTSFGITEVPALTNEGIPILDEKGNQMMKKYSYVEFKESNEVDGTIISEVSQGKNGVKIKLEDKMKALQWLSDRMDLMPTQAKERMEIEKIKIYGEEEEFEDDGFIEALKSQINEVWEDD